VRVARPRDDAWISWDKGPVVVTPPPEHDLTAFRDPTVFWDRSTWRMIVGAGYADGTAAVLSFSSADLNKWTFDGVAARRHAGEQQPIWTGQVWECPQLVAIGDRHVLIVSVWADGEGHYVAAAVGSYRDGKFNAERWTRLTYGDTDHYAASAFIDADGQPGLTFWIRGIGDHASGWMGAISIPYRISLVDGNVSLTPHPGVRPSQSSLRGVLGLDWTPSADKPTDQVSISSASGLTLATLETSGSLLTVSSPGGVVQLPLGPGPVHVLADGPVLEICTGPAIAGLPIATAPSQVFATDPVTVT
jgi:beta-fructofuranosidase